LRESFQPHPPNLDSAICVCTHAFSPTRPFVLTYQPSCPIFQFQMQYNVMLLHLGNETLAMPHVPSLIPQPHRYHFSLGPYQDRANQTETNDLYLHASCGMVRNDCVITHHSVGGFYNARSGSAGGPPSSGVSTTVSRQRRRRAWMWSARIDAAIDFRSRW